MRKLSLYVFGIALTLGVAAVVLTGVVTRTNQSASAGINQATNAAFRDGLYVGKLHAAQGNRPHLGSGRWSTDLDRRAYVVGYQKGYNQVLQSRAGRIASPQAAELTGYRDGINDGASDRRSSMPFRLSHTENYRRAVRAISEVQSDQENSRNAYRRAYANGYQEAYYGHDHAVPNAEAELSSSL